MVFPRRVQDPNSVIDYPIDLTDFTAKGDPATAIPATISPTAPTITNTPTLTAGMAKARVNGTGMTLKQTYTLKFHFTLASGQEDDRSLTIYCDER